MRALCAVLVVSLPACLVLNEDFVDGDEGGEATAASTTADATSSSASASASATGGTAMGMSMSGGESSSSTGPMGCADDMYEANNQEGAAAVLPAVDFASPELMWSATIGGSGGEDWFQVHGTDVAATNLGEPTITVTPATVDVCVYVLCDSGTASTAVECEGSTTFGDSPVQGLIGCCHGGDGVIPIRYSCETEATATFFIEARGSDTICDYGLSFDYPA